MKLKDLLGVLGKESSVAALPGTRAFANPMSLQGDHDESSSSSEEGAPPKSPARLRSPLR